MVHGSTQTLLLCILGRVAEGTPDALGYWIIEPTPEFHPEVRAAGKSLDADSLLPGKR